MTSDEGGQKPPPVPDLDLATPDAQGRSEPRPDASPQASRIPAFAHPRAAVPVEQLPPEEPGPILQNLPPAELIPMEVDPGGASAEDARAPAASAPAGPGPARFDAELDLGPAAPAPASRPQQSAAAAVPVPGSQASDGSLDYFGAGTFDDDDFDGFSQGNLMDIGLGGGPPVAAQPTSAQQVEGEQWPTGRSPDPQSIRVDPLEVALTADFGDRPTSALSAPPYAYRVLLRRRDLRAAVGQLRDQLATAEAHRDERLAEMVRSVREAVEADGGLARLVEGLAELERTVADRSGALAGTNAEFAARLEQLDVRAAQLDREVAAKREQETVLAAEVAARAEPHKKATVHLKRMHIELRSLGQIAQNAAKTGGTLAPDHTAKVRAFEAKAAEVKAQVDVLQTELAKAKAPLDALRNEIERIERSKRDLGAQRRQLESEYQRQAEVRSKGVDQASRHLRARLADAGRGLLATRGGIAIDEGHLRAVAEADDQVARCAYELEKHVRAMESHDRSAVKTGLVLAGVAAGVVLALLVLLIVT